MVHLIPTAPARVPLFRQDVNYKTRLTLFITLIIGIIPSISYGQEDPSTILVPYSSGANRALGDGVNIEFPYVPVGRCVNYKKDDVDWDNSGSISSDGRIEVVSSDEEEKRTANISLGYQTLAKLKAGIFNANSEFNADVTTENYRFSASKTITVAFRAQGDYGRHLIQNYSLDPNAPTPSANISEFRQRCGTHFIRGERRASNLTILIRIASSSSQGRDALTANLKKILGGGVALKDIGGEAGNTLTASYKSVIEFAKKTGNVSVDYRAKGGPGIAAAGAAAKIIDPSDFNKISDIVSNVSTLFTRDNSGITAYFLQANTALGAPPVNFDADRVEKIGVLTRSLLALSDAAKRYEDIKSSSNEAYEKYFRSFADRANTARASLVQKISLCSSGGDCTIPSTDVVRDYVFLEDLFYRSKVSLSCQYQSATAVNPIVGKSISDPQLLESISINIEGSIHAPDFVDFSSVRVVQLTPKNLVQDVSSEFSGFDLSQPSARNEKRAFGTIYSTNLRLKDLVKFNLAKRDFEIDMAELQKRREEVLNSAFSVFAPGPNGVKISYDLGFPPRDGCPVVKSSS